MKVYEKLGIDIGNVIIDHRAGVDVFDGMTGRAYAAIPEVENALKSIRTLRDGRFGPSIVLVSHASAWAEQKIRFWLDHHAFFEKTGVARDQVRFCRDRRDKAAICAREAVTHFVDDRPEVLQHLQGVVTHRYLFGALAELSVEQVRSMGLTVCENWTDAERMLLADRNQEIRWSRAA